MLGNNRQRLNKMQRTELPRWSRPTQSEEPL
jgi:hypothetical protein